MAVSETISEFKERCNAGALYWSELGVKVASGWRLPAIEPMYRFHGEVRPKKINVIVNMNLCGVVRPPRITSPFYFLIYVTHLFLSLCYY
jgi:hypothetical protein